MRINYGHEGGLPVLEKVLGNKALSNHYDYLHTIGVNFFENFNLFVKIAASVKERNADLFSAVRGDPKAADAAIDDLQTLMKELREITEVANREIRDLESLCGEVHRAGWPDAH